MLNLKFDKNRILSNSSLAELALPVIGEKYIQWMDYLIFL